MSVLILDTETTGLDFNKDRIIEIAAMVTSDDFTEVLATYQTFVHQDGYPEITPEITKLTGITRAMQLEEGTTIPIEALTRVQALAHKYGCGYFLAYNEEFDRRMVMGHLEREGVSPTLGLPWLCAMRDLETNQEYKCWKLSHLALDRGVAVDPKDLHRAMGDVELTRKLLVSARTHVQDLAFYNRVPYVVVTAMVPHPREPSSEAKRDIAKKAGFSWQSFKGDPDNAVYEKRWVKRIKETDLEKLKASTPLPIRVI